MDDAALRGITIGQIRAIWQFVEAHCEGDKWMGELPVVGPGGPELDAEGFLRLERQALTPDTVNFYHLDELVTLPATVATAARRDVALVELMAAGPQPPRAFISHAWALPLGQTVRVVEQYYRDHKLEEEEDAVWISAFALRPHARAVAPSIAESDFVRAVAGCEWTVAVMDEEATALARAWCVVEVYEALAAGKMVDVYALDAAGQVQRSTDGLLPAEDAAQKRLREARLPPQVLRRGMAFTLNGMEASLAEDEDLIDEHIIDGAGVDAVVSTLRARFFVAGLSQVAHDDQAVAQGLRALQRSRLRRVAIAEVPLAGLGTRIAAHLPATVVDLTMEDARLFDEGARAVAAFLRDGGASVASLSLPLNAIFDAGAVALIAALPPSTALVNLRFNHVGDRGAAALAEVLRGSTTLALVDLVSNMVTSSGAAALGTALEHNTALTHLNLESNLIEDAGAAALAAALRRNSTLVYLNVNDAGIGDAGAAALAEGLRANRALRVVHLGWNGIGSDGTIALAEALPLNEGTVTHLDLTDNRIGDRGAKALAMALVDTRVHLAKLHLLWTGIGEAEKSALAATRVPGLELQL